MAQRRSTFTSQKTVFKSIPSVTHLEFEHNKKLRSECGQRILGPIPGTPEHLYGRPNKGTQIFVSHLPTSVYEDTIFPLFATAGAIYEMRLMMEFSGYTRGFCFITYETKTSAETAIKALHGTMVQTNKISVYKSVDNCKLHISGLPNDKGRDDIMGELSGVHGLIDVWVKVLASGKNRGYAFLEFDTHKNAAIARKHLWPTFQLFDREVDVEWAKPEKSQFMCDDAKLIIRNLLPNVTKEGLIDFVTQYFHLKTLRNCFKKVGTTYAFLEFSTVKYANYALKELQGVFWNGKNLAVDWAYRSPNRNQKEASKSHQDASGEAHRSPTPEASSSSTQTLFLPSTSSQNPWGCASQIEELLIQGMPPEIRNNHNYFNPNACIDQTDNPLVLNNRGFYTPPFFKTIRNPELDNLPQNVLAEKYFELIRYISPKPAAKRPAVPKEEMDEDDLLLKEVFDCLNY